MITNNLLLIKKGDVFTKYPLNGGQVSFIPKEGDDLCCVFIVYDGNINVNVNLEYANTSCDIKVIYLANEKKNVDIQISVNHIVGNTSSRQEIKGIANQEASVSFYGKIYIAKDAQKSEGYQNHRAVLLSNKALIESTPSLEIYADDVKCSHGSATGALPQEALFYLMTRGIEKKKATSLLLEAFVNEIVPTEYQETTSEWIKENV